jgi:hypothetical protein
MNGVLGPTGALFAPAVIAPTGDEFMMPAGAAPRAWKSVTEAAQFEASDERPKRSPIGGCGAPTSGARRAAKDRSNDQGTARNQRLHDVVFVGVRWQLGDTASW